MIKPNILLFILTTLFLFQPELWSACDETKESYSQHVEAEFKSSDPKAPKRIKEQLATLSRLSPEINPEGRRRILILPSITLDVKDIRLIKGVLFYETRGLWETLAASHPNTEVVFITSIPVESSALHHLYSQFPEYSQFKNRIRFLHLNDPSKTPLVEKVLHSSANMKRIRELIIPGETYISAWTTTKKEFQLAKELNIPIMGSDPALNYWGSKSGARRIFKEAEVSATDGITDIMSPSMMIKSVEKLWLRNKDAKKFMVKLNEGVSGLGNAELKLPSPGDPRHILNLSASQRLKVIEELLTEMKFVDPNHSWESFGKKLRGNGGVVEVFLEKVTSSPSGQGFIHPNGHIEILSTHEQILNGQVFQGASFPAKQSYRQQVQEMTRAIGQKMAQKGAVGYFAVDYLVRENAHSPTLMAVEINFRQGGTTHLLRTTSMATQSTYDPHTGMLKDSQGQVFVYKGTDNLLSPHLKGVEPQQLFTYFKERGLLFDPLHKTGVIFHLLGNLKPNGKVGFVAIGKSQAEANAIYEQVYQAGMEFH